MRRAATPAMGWTIAAAAACLASCQGTTAPPPPGVLVVSSTVSIAIDGQPFSYRVAVDTLPPVTLASDAIENTFRVGPLRQGEHVVALQQLATACTSGSDSRHVTLNGGDTVRVVFNIQCTRTTGDLAVTMSTTGTDVDPDGYVMLLDGIIARSVARNGTRTFARLTAGAHVLSISEVDDNCTLTGPASRQVTITAAQTTSLTLPVTCTAIPNGSMGFTAQDPQADTLPNAAGTLKPALDLVRIDGRYGPGWLILVAHFSGPVTAAAGNGPNALTGFLDLDVDENANTGMPAGINRYGGVVNQGVDYEISFQTGTSDPGIAALLDADGVFAYVASAYAGDSVVLRIPLRKLGNDDGNLTLSAVIGTSERPTDLVPNAGLIIARTPAPLISGRLGAAARETNRARPNRELPLIRGPLSLGRARGTSPSGARAWVGR